MTGRGRGVATFSGIALIVLGGVVIAAGFMPWVDLSTVGLRALNPDGFGFRRYDSSLGVGGLGWATTLLGLITIVSGILVLFDKRTAAVVATGAGSALAVISGAVWVWPLALTVNRAELGIVDVPAHEVATVSMGLVVLFVAGVLIAVIGGWASFSMSRPSSVGGGAALVIAGVVGVLFGAISLLLAWWLLGGTEVTAH